jgi:hypothetical protein
VKSREAALLKSCPPAFAPSSITAWNLPIDVTRWGAEGSRVLIIHGNVQAGLPIGGGPRSFAKQKILIQRGWRLEIPVLVITGGWSPGRDAMGEVVAGLTGGKHVTVRSPDHVVMAAQRRRRAAELRLRSRTRKAQTAARALAVADAVDDFRRRFEVWVVRASLNATVTLFHQVADVLTGRTETLCGLSNRCLAAEARARLVDDGAARS